MFSRVVARRQSQPLRLPLKSRSPQRQTSVGFPSLTLYNDIHATSLNQDPSNTMSKPKNHHETKSTPRWQSISWQKKDQQFARIPSEWRLPNLPPANVTNYLGVPRECGILTEKELEITENYDATALATAIRDGRLKCVAVTTAFCKAGLSKT